MNRANDSIHKHLDAKLRAGMEKSLERAFALVLDAMLMDWRLDFNTKDTPKRLSRMYLREVFAGRYTPPPKMTSFPNARRLDEVYVVGPVSVRSTCAHHFAPIVGRAWIGVLPSSKIIGLSKFSRLTAWVMARPQIQEEATIMLADELEARLKPQALAVVVRASHLCMTWRGVKEHDTTLTTSVMRGLFRSDPALRAEVLALIGGGL